MLFALFLLLSVISLYIVGYFDGGRFRSYCEVAANRRGFKLPLIVSGLLLVFFDRSILALSIYSLGHRVRNPLIGRVLTNLMHFLTGIEIYFNAEVGKGCQIWHGQGTVIGQNSVIGSGCLILHQVTLGSGFVVIGDNVKIGCGAKILGNLRVGNGCVISANAVVTKDVPENSLVKSNGEVIDLDFSKSVVFGTR